MGSENLGVFASRAGQTRRGRRDLNSHNLAVAKSNGHRTGNRDSGENEALIASRFAAVNDYFASGGINRGAVWESVPAC